MTMTIKDVEQHSGVGSPIDNTRLDTTVQQCLRFEIPIAAGKAGTIASGTLTLSTGHGITTGNTIDVFWDSGASARLGVSVGTVSGNSVPISGGTGDTLPADGTSIVAFKPVTYNCMAFHPTYNAKIYINWSSNGGGVTSMLDITMKDSTLTYVVTRFSAVNNEVWNMFADTTEWTTDWALDFDGNPTRLVERIIYSNRTAFAGTLSIVIAP